ncbi:MAG: FAD-binding protein, partial [Acidobacteria bacterium]|nr:FAD-binding protein [Acidobacteriota bacterium]
MPQPPERLVHVVGRDRVREDVPLAPFTTFRIGGPADWMIDAGTTDEITGVVRAAHLDGVALTVLGGGSNVLVADAGVRGVVLRPRTHAIALVAPGLVSVDAGVSFNGLVRWAILEGLGGLEAWAGTPGSVGGAVFGNAHFGGQSIGDLVYEVDLVDRTGAVSAAPASQLAFAYDHSR